MGILSAVIATVANVSTTPISRQIADQSPLD